MIKRHHALEKEMATHSSVLAWRIPGTEEPGGLPSRGSHRVGHTTGEIIQEIQEYLMLALSVSPFMPRGTALRVVKGLWEYLRHFQGIPELTS